jgi:hypothetical protein
MLMIYKKDDSICPLCEQSNRCDVKASSSCWCMNTQVPEALLEKIPAYLKGVSCVCNACIGRYHAQQALVANPKKVS